MSRNISREESLRIAAERMRQKKEQEEREENEFYERITSGPQWSTFKVIVLLCTLVAVITTIDVFFDGPTKKLTEEDCKIDRSWEWPWHKVLDVEGYSFAPLLRDWSDRADNSIEITYSPIFRAGKKLSWDVEVNERITRRHEEIRWRSIFTWFPAVQIFLLIPLATFIFKRQRPWFNFARILSMFVIFPGMLMMIYSAIY